jgi:tetratricopeptide (TPR) repeat protein
VLGQHFDPEMLSALDDRADQLDGHNGEGLLRGSGASYGFSHALVRDAVYATLLTSLRGDLHRRAAELTAHGDPALSAEHWERAEDERAGRAYLLAARHAASSDRLREAVQLCERGLLWAVDTDCRFELCLARAELLGRSAEPERAESAAREVLSLATTTSQRARAWLALAEALRGTLRDDGALCALDAAEQLTPKSDHQSRAQIHYLRGSVLFPRARGAQSLECHEQALEHARLAGSTAAQARALSGIGDAHYIQGRMLSARDNFERSIELSTRDGLRRLVDVNRVMVAITTLYHLSLADADRVMRGIALSAAESCDLGLESLAWSSLALIPRSDAVQAEADLQRAIELSQRGQPGPALPLVRSTSRVRGGGATNSL